MVILRFKGSKVDWGGGQDVGMLEVMVKDRIVPGFVGDHIQENFIRMRHEIQGGQFNDKFALAVLFLVRQLHLKFHSMRAHSVFGENILSTLFLDVSLECFNLFHQCRVALIDPRHCRLFVCIGQML